MNVDEGDVGQKQNVRHVDTHVRALDSRSAPFIKHLWSHGNRDLPQNNDSKSNFHFLVTMKQSVLFTALLVLATTSFALPQDELSLPQAEPSLPTTGQCYVDSNGDTWYIYSNDEGQDVVADWDAAKSGNTAIGGSKAAGKGGHINYRSLEKPPICNANVCYNCIKPISSGSNRPCTVYTKCKRGIKGASAPSCK